VPVGDGISPCRALTVDLQSEERLPYKMSDLVELVSKKPLQAHTKTLLVEVMVCDEEGEEVDVSGETFVLFDRWR